MSTYPEHEKLKASRETHLTVSEFLEYLESNGYYITYAKEPYKTIRNENLIADFLGIDKKKFDEEKELMYQELKNSHKKA